MYLGHTQNPPAAMQVYFSPPLSRFVHCAAPTARRQGAPAYPLTVLVGAADTLTRAGSGASRSAIGTCLFGTVFTFQPWAFLIVAMCKSSCRLTAG